MSATEKEVKPSGSGWVNPKTITVGIATFFAGAAATFSVLVDSNPHKTLGNAAKLSWVFSNTDEQIVHGVAGTSNAPVSYLVVRPKNTPVEVIVTEPNASRLSNQASSVADILDLGPR